MRRVLFVPAITALVALAACADDGTTTAPGGAAAVSTPESGGVDDVATVLELTAPVVGGGSIDLADYADAPLALWFWAPF